MTCKKCGAYIPDGGKICLACGWKPDDDNEHIFNELFTDDNPYIKYLQQVMDTVVNEFPKDDSRLAEHDNTGWTAAAGYLGPTFIYTYLKNRDSELICYHANQSCLLFVAYLVLGLLDKLPLGGILKKAGRTAVFFFAFNGMRNAVARKKEPASPLGALGMEIIKS